jgi:LPS sulfotransferase NodH
MASLILCATPRSGSTLLCDLLAATGLAGRPDSFYRRQDIGYWAARLGVAPGEGAAFERAYLEAVRQHGTGDTGMFALRLMWPSLPELSARLGQLFPGLPDDAARFERAFGPPLYLHLSRRNKVAQAVSRLKAEQTGLWHLAADGSERERTAPPQAPRYDGDRLAAFVAEAEAADTAWAAWFAQQSITPLRLHYEDVSADPRTAVATILSTLGRNPEAARTAEVQTTRMADAESLAWVARFTRERAGV